MNINELLNLGEQYSKKELSKILGESNLELVREGVYSCKESSSYLLFVDLEKKDKEERFHFNDFFEEDYFHWDSQTTQHINSPKIQSILSGDLSVYLFVRISQKIKSITQPFVYMGQLEYLEHDPKTSKPVHIIFGSMDYDDFTSNSLLKEIYDWEPSKIGKTSNSPITKKGQISERRQRNYSKPNKTESTGLVTSRVGQGYYRNQVIKKWNGKCPITGIDIPSILISSHIKRWSDSSDEERLDPENGILLSPIFDSLFDRHLISFEDNGNILISNLIDSSNLLLMGIDNNISISVTKGMIPYLEEHRKKLKEKELKES